MAIAASSVTPTNSLEDFRIEFNNLVSDVSGITATNKFTENIIFEGATADAYETTLTVTDPTADRTVTIPNATDTLVGKATTDTLTNKTLASPSLTGDITWTNTDADANSGPVLNLYRNSASPSDDDLLGEILYKGENDADQIVEYASIVATSSDVSDGQEDGAFNLDVMVAGTKTDAIRFAPVAGTASIVQTLHSAASTAAVPNVTFIGDNDTGMYRPGANQIGFTTAGTKRLSIDNTNIEIVGGLIPATADGSALGGASNEWSDLYLADGSVIYFGADQDVTLTHSADSGLLLKRTATADDTIMHFVLQTGETDMAADDVIGKISFQAPDEGTGTDAILISAAIQAVAEGDHSSSSNATSLVLMTGASEAATAKVKVTSAGHLMPATADGSALGGTSNEWSDLYLADGSIIYFGADQDVTLTHVHEGGIRLKRTATADDTIMHLELQTGEVDIEANDILGKISFRAPDEGTGTDAILISAAIQARSETDFSSSINATSLDFMTGASEAATKKWSITSTGSFLNAGTNTIDMNAGELILDADQDTSITADTDDQIDFKISGADDFRMTANTFTVLSGSTLTIPSGATLTAASGSTLNGFGTDATATALAIALG